MSYESPSWTRIPTLREAGESLARSRGSADGRAVMHGLVACVIARLEGHALTYGICKRNCDAEWKRYAKLDRPPNDQAHLPRPESEL